MMIQYVQMNELTKAMMRKMSPPLTCLSLDDAEFGAGGKMLNNEYTRSSLPKFYICDASV